MKTLATSGDVASIVKSSISYRGLNFLQYARGIDDEEILKMAFDVITFSSQTTRTSETLSSD